MKFIELTSSNLSKIYVNFDLIATIRDDMESGLTVLESADNFIINCVVEKPEEILVKLDPFSFRIPANSAMFGSVNTSL